MSGPRKTAASLILPCLAAALLAAGCAGHYPQTTLSPHSDVGWMIQHLLNNIVAWCIGIFIVVEGLLVLAIFKFRRRDDHHVPEAVHGHTALEVGWTIAPAVILLFIAWPTVSTIFKIGMANPKAKLHVEVVGHQWWWEFKYPQQNVVTANELHLPVGQTVNFDLKTADVIHSFWLPAFGGKRDVEPNRVNHMWFTPDTVGTFPGQCGEYCGMSHANMRMKVVVERPEEFDAWIRSQQSTGPPVAAAESTGASLFAHGPCIACHTMAGVPAAQGMIGPNLTHVGSRGSIAGAILANNPENLARWLRDPPANKPGTLMPKLGLPEDQIQALVLYLESR